LIIGVLNIAGTTESQEQEQDILTTKPDHGPWWVGAYHPLLYVWDFKKMSALDSFAV
jgi:hypothetical protein